MFRIVADPAPVSAPPFGAIPVNPFGNFAAPPPSLYVGTDVASPVIAPQPTPTSFYLIPAAAAGGWARPVIAPGVVPPGNILPQLTPIDVEAWAKANKQLQQTKLKAKTPQNRVPQLREEMVIRNSDSGKNKYRISLQGISLPLCYKYLGNALSQAQIETHFIYAIS
ncbi:unnamed protein product [Gongylonema pulchrum]|uniref:Uncharacterized protein n=1 Tax=Gongylonema pulchrum TaxID=637853 RepID=A0A183EFU5_9BILA|nr:unnamed protein product [Gongylonema pulchrum]